MIDPEQDPPELVGAQDDDERPLRGRTRLRVLRIVVVVGLVALVLPSIVVTATTAARTAELACRIVVAERAPDAVAAVARFELAAPAGPGWYCYEVGFGGREVLLRDLGLIPQVVRVPATPNALAA